MSPNSASESRALPSRPQGLANWPNLFGLLAGVKVINLTREENLNEAEYTWKPVVNVAAKESRKAKLANKVDVLAKMVGPILNKPRPQKFGTLMAQF